MEQADVDKELLALFTGIISGIIGAVITYFATRSKTRLDLIAQYDKDLRQNRLQAYKQLWVKLKPLARYQPEAELTVEIVKSTSIAMRDWYFEPEGGIYLTYESRKPYFTLKDTMDNMIKIVPEGDHKKPLDLKDQRIYAFYKSILKQGTKLRASLSDDVDTRRQLWLSRSRTQSGY